MKFQNKNQKSLLIFPLLVIIFKSKESPFSFEPLKHICCILDEILILFKVLMTIKLVPNQCSFAFII